MKCLKGLSQFVYKTNMHKFEFKFRSINIWQRQLMNG